ncbi:hypothetical protein Pan216_09950 [Planctomycetes bacterium Pan216]|uniref:Uncharacterized protein n=1 Tax=Kolteria novifilia TaxID=2527975 RepID=A0A518AZH6_9BACT|nr:hypothetical protein Pan216_09950 [Planctomycetes bacterium Pan216]
MIRATIWRHMPAMFATLAMIGSPLAAQAGGKWRPFKKKCASCVECEPCPCDISIYPEASEPESTEAPTEAPTTPDDMQAPTDDLTDAPEPSPEMSDLLSDSLTGTDFSAANAPTNLAPYMIGDGFGGGPLAIDIPNVIPGILNGQTGTLSISNVQGSPSYEGSGPVIFSTGTVPQPTTLSISALGVQQQLAPQTLDTQSVNSFPADTLPQSAEILAPDASITAQAAQGVQTIEEINAAQVAPGSTVVSSVTNESNVAEQTESGSLYSANYNYTAESRYISQETVLISVANPSGGGAVGRLKVAENNSPMPRDRVFFNYNYFDDVPYSSSGVDVSRYTPGFEKTFFNRMASIEFRMPFAGTLNSNQVLNSGPGVDQVEFGNIGFNLKALLYATQNFGISVGSGLAIPTADDVTVRDTANDVLVRINNQSVHLMPYIGAVFAPNDRFFAQGFLQADFGTNGNAVWEDLDGIGGLNKAGVLTDQTLGYIDASIGYWVMKHRDYGVLTAVAPMLELHYTTTMGQVDRIQQGSFVIGDFAANQDILNLTTGVSLELFGRANAVLAAGTPLKGGISGRQFDWELQAQISYRFGPQNRLTRANF